jgi:hypothetical protein
MHEKTVRVDIKQESGKLIIEVTDPEGNDQRISSTIANLINTTWINEGMKLQAQAKNLTRIMQFFIDGKTEAKDAQVLLTVPSYWYDEAKRFLNG